MMRAGMKNTGWHEGTIGSPIGSKNPKVARFWVKAYEIGSEYGIDGGKISKLRIEVDGVATCNYDRGWDVKPNEDDEITMLAYSILLHDYN